MVNIFETLIRLNNCQGNLCQTVLTLNCMRKGSGITELSAIYCLDYTFMTQ